MNALRPWLELARISNLPTVWTNVLAGWLLAGGEGNGSAIFWLLAGGSVIYIGGMMLNDAADVRFDRKYRQERPIPSGRVSLLAVWVAGLLFVPGGAALLVWGGGACPWLAAGLAGCIVAYDLYHKPWAGSVFVMGSCRTMLFLVAASAVTGGLDPVEDLEVVIKAIALGGYVVGLTLVARHESRPANAGGWQKWVGWTGLALPLLVAAWFARTPSGDGSGWLLAVRGVMPLLVLACVGRALHLMKTPPASNIGRAVGLLLAGIVLVDATAVGATVPAAALGFALSFPLLLLWQRKIAAT